MLPAYANDLVAAIERVLDHVLTQLPGRPTMQTFTVSSSLQIQKRGRLAERYLSLVPLLGISKRCGQGTKGAL